MTNKFHKNLTLDDNHEVIARQYGTITARDADTLFNTNSLNLNKIVRVEDNGAMEIAYFILVSVGPAVWLEITSTLSNSFLELTDTPSSYSGQLGTVVQVNPLETGLEFGQKLRTSDDPTFSGLTTNLFFIAQGTITGLGNMTIASPTFVVDSVANQVNVGFVGTGSSTIHIKTKQAKVGLMVEEEAGQTADLVQFVDPSETNILFRMIPGGDVVYQVPFFTGSNNAFQILGPKAPLSGPANLINFNVNTASQIIDLKKLVVNPFIAVAPAVLSDLTIFQSDMDTKGLTFSGETVTGASTTADGVSLYTGVLAGNNLQLWVAQFLQQGDAAKVGLRMTVGGDLPNLSAMSLDGLANRHFGLGNAGSRVGVGFGILDTQADILSKLHVITVGGADIGLIIAVPTTPAQTGDLFQARNSVGTPLITIEATGILELTEGVRDSVGLLGTVGQVLTSTGTKILWAGSATGDVVGPGSSTLFAFVRYADTSGKLIKDTSTATINDTGQVVFQNSADSLVAFRINTNGAVNLFNVDTINEEIKINDLFITADLNLAGAFEDSASSPGTAGQRLSSTVTGTAWVTDLGGDVVGPAGATPNAIATYNGGTGKFIQNSTVTIVGGLLTIPVSGSLIVDTDTFVVDGAADKVTIGAVATGLTDFTVFQTTATDKGITLAGDTPQGSSDNTDGATVYLASTFLGFRALQFAQTSDLGNSAKNAFRFLLGPDTPTISGSTVTHSANRHINIGNQTAEANVGVGHTAAVAQTALDGVKLFVKSGVNTQAVLRVQGEASQTGDLFQARNSTPVDLFKIESDGDVVISAVGSSSGTPRKFQMLNGPTEFNRFLFGGSTGMQSANGFGLDIFAFNPIRIFGATVGGAPPYAAVSGFSLLITNTVAANRAVIIDGAASQLGSLFQVRGNVDNVLSELDEDGKLTVGGLKLATVADRSMLDVRGSVAWLRVGSAVSVGTVDEVFIGITDTTAARTVTITDADIVVGRIFIINDESGAASSTFPITIQATTPASHPIDGANSVQITAPNGTVRLYNDGTNLFSW